MAANPERIEAPSRAWRVLPPTSPVGDGKRPRRLAGPKPVYLIGVKGEPAAQRVVEIVDLARAEQTIISRLALQLPVAGMPVRSRPLVGEDKRSACRLMEHTFPRYFMSQRVQPLRASRGNIRPEPVRELLPSPPNQYAPLARATTARRRRGGR
jgi:hypothetical protein